MKAIFPDSKSEKDYVLAVIDSYSHFFFTKKQLKEPIVKTVRLVRNLLQEDNSEFMALSNIRLLRMFPKENSSLAVGLLHGLRIAYAYWSGDKDYIRYQTEDVSKIPLPEDQQSYISFIQEMTADVVTTLCNLNEAKISDESKQKFNKEHGSDYFKIGTAPATEISERPAIRTQTKSNAEKQPACCLML